MNQQTAQQSIYEAEINVLAEVNPQAVHMVSLPAQEYLATERVLLLQELLKLNQQV